MTNKTVYVVGAGASCEVKMPVGETLKKEIAELLVMKFSRGNFSRGNQELYYALHGLCENNIEELQQYCTECRYISNNMHLAISIDNFIDSNRGNEKLALCGKIGIVEAILEAERRSTIFYEKISIDSEMDYSELDGTWYIQFFRTITENCAVEDLEERFSHIAMIIFNYDRCVEFFLLNTLMKYYRISEKEAVRLIQCIEIIHPYGTVGSLPEFSDGRPSMKYGGVLRRMWHVRTAENIYTFTEGGVSEEVDRLRRIMNSSDRFIFLGFAFHRLNMSLLSNVGDAPYPVKRIKQCFGTAFGVSENDQESIRSSISALFSSEVEIYVENATCNEFFINNTRSLGYD